MNFRQVHGGALAFPHIVPRMGMRGGVLPNTGANMGSTADKAWPFPHRIYST